MLKNYLRTALRNLTKHKLYSMINVFGLALGIACCLLIYLFVHDEFAYDKFHDKADRIYRVQNVTYNPDGSERSSYSNHPVPLGPALKADLPEVQEYARFRAIEHFIRTDGEAIKESVLYADSTILKVFSFPLARGNPTTALQNLKSVVISQKAAQKYFGKADPLGKTLQVRIVEEFQEFFVTGVAKNVPGNSTIKFDILVPFDNLFTYFGDHPTFPTSWDWISIQTYVSLAKSASIDSTPSKLEALFLKYYGEEEQSNEVTYSFRFQPITEIHLTSESKALYSYILSGIAFIILVIACVNFTTLSIARSASRSVEVGLRKVVGARQKQLVFQHLGEAWLHSFLALILGFVLAQLLLPVFNDLAEKQLRFSISDWSIPLAAILMTFFAGIIAGGYPALMLSSYRPVHLLKQKLRLSGSNAFTRALVILQFALTIFLVVNTLVMSSQLSYTRSKELGYDKDLVVILEMNGIDGTMVADRLRSVVQRTPGIEDITATGNTLGRRSTSGTRYKYEGKTHTISIFPVQPNYLEFLGLQLLEGRSFDRNITSDLKNAVIVNEALLYDFDLEDPIGKAVPGYPGEAKDAPVIIGVVKDYHFQSLYQEIIPMMLTQNREWDYDYLLVKIQPVNISETIASLKTAWREIAPEVPFVYRFSDDERQSQYVADLRWKQIVEYASFFAILIACLGLLGLTSLAAVSRTKEVGIRKVLGAPVTNIILLLSKEFVWLVLIGNILGAPVAYFTMQSWLQNFAFRTEIGWSVFVLAAFLAVFIALLTMGAQVAKAALANPVDSLRYE